MAKRTSKKGTRRAKAPFAVGGGRPSRLDDTSEAVHRDLLAAIDEALATLQGLRGRVEQLRDEAARRDRAAAVAMNTLGATTPRGSD